MARFKEPSGYHTKWTNWPFVTKNKFDPINEVADTDETLSRVGTKGGDRTFGQVLQDGGFEVEPNYKQLACSFPLPCY